MLCIPSITASTRRRPRAAPIATASAQSAATPVDSVTHVNIVSPPAGRTAESAPIRLVVHFLCPDQGARLPPDPLLAPVTHQTVRRPLASGPPPVTAATSRLDAMADGGDPP